MTFSHSFPWKTRTILLKVAAGSAFNLILQACRRFLQQRYVTRIMLLLLLLFLAGVSHQQIQPGEFPAGSVVVTQKALDEAPTRYADIMMQVVAYAATFIPPTMEGGGCLTGFAYDTSGERGKERVRPSENHIATGWRLDTE